MRAREKDLDAGASFDMIVGTEFAAIIVSECSPPSRRKPIECPNGDLCKWQGRATGLLECHKVAATALDVRDERCFARPEHSIAFPIAEPSTLIDNGRPLSDVQSRVAPSSACEPEFTSTTASVLLSELAIKRAAGSCVRFDPCIDLFCTDAHGGVVGEVRNQAPRNSLGRPEGT